MRYALLPVMFFVSTAVITTFGLGGGRALDASATLATQSQAPTPDPWTNAQTIEPADIVKMLSPSAGTRPKVVGVGFPSLFRGGHVPTAEYHGPASSAEGLASLKQWAEGLPRSTGIVMYCGCCPMAQCPNVRPAFKLLREMGFTEVRVLMLPTSFAADWAGKGYPVER